MELLKIRQEFIEMRAQGVSFDKIAVKLKICKQTLIDWSKEFQEEIANCKALELDALYETYYLKKEYTIKQFANMLHKIEDELKKRNLEDVSTDK